MAELDCRSSGELDDAELLGDELVQVEVKDIYDLSAVRNLGKAPQSEDVRRQREATMEQVARLAASYRKDMRRVPALVALHRSSTTPCNVAQEDEELEALEDHPVEVEEVQRAAQAAVHNASGHSQAAEHLQVHNSSQPTTRVLVEPPEPATPLTPMLDPDSPLTPFGGGRACSWEGVENTVVLFDWDDTLFPTTHLRFEVRPKQPPNKQNEPLPVGSPEHAALVRHGELLHDVLACARSVGEVAIVTLSTRPWVLASAETYLPNFDFPALLEALNIPVYYAFEFLSKENKLRAQREEGLDVLTEYKRHAMSRCLRRFYQGKTVRPHVISIGDSTAEQNAVKDVLWAWDGLVAPPLCKTVKLINEPTIDQLGAELELLSAWLPRMAAFYKDFDFCMDDEDSLHGSAECLSDP
mmetsp:Transcript_56568/g.127167  ORF Transcript_56568/g.127167 Transcript_56568/m.127167 type:complete len:412 (+) Transcript_56568:144-1379(+)